ncbi:MAG: hypothetical protein AAGN35_20725 [Bacteroidota bacterium]
MKRFNTNLFFLSLIMLLIFGTACDREEFLMEDPIPQFSTDPCAGLLPEDLDLGPGYQGTIVTNTDPDLPDFVLKRALTTYKFPVSLAADSCAGYCALNVRFKDADDSNPIIWANLQLDEFTLSYEDAGTIITEDIVNYTWNAPDLTILDVIPQTTVDYNISFVNAMGEEVAISEVTVAGGLCIVDNVNNTDPLVIPYRGLEGGDD